jgi:hypothetical protein
VAAPFGGLPRFQDYIRWALHEQGCKYQTGYSQVGKKVETFVVLENPANDKHTIEFIPLEEFLTPSLVSALDRRLGLDSPFPKLVSYD